MQYFSVQNYYIQTITNSVLKLKIHLMHHIPKSNQANSNIIGLQVFNKWRSLTLYTVTTLLLRQYFLIIITVATHAKIS